jgi:hypothetical protein
MANPFSGIAVWWRDTRPRERAKWTDVAIAFLTAAIVYFAYGTGAQTDQLIAAANIQACAAQRNADAAASFAVSAAGINTQTAAAVGQFDRIAKDAERSISETQKEATKSIKTAQHNADRSFAASVQIAQLDERPWIGLVDEKILHFAKNEPFHMRFTFLNSGKTPALRVRRTKLEVQILPEDFGEPTVEASGWRDTGPAPPRAPLEVDWDDSTPDAANFVGRDYAAIMGGKTSFLYVWGAVQYWDAFDKIFPHTTKFCYKFDAISRFFVLCEKGNEMN